MKLTSHPMLTPLFKLALLPTIVAASLMISACQDTSAPSETPPADSESATMTTPSTQDEVDSMSVEEKTIDKLSRYRWTLARAEDDRQQPIAPLMDIKDQVTLRFNQHQGQNSISYSVGCNTISATYKLDGTQLITDAGMSTKMLCPTLNDAENRLHAFMQGESELVVSDDTPATLTQITDEDITLIWTGRMTPQAKYNSNGETLFWAVSAETKPCTDNKGQMCLQIQPITYDDQGIKTSEGEWREFAGIIDGYQHDGMHDEVLRLQRYETNTDTVLADNVDSNYAYVLDTVIESSVAE